MDLHKSFRLDAERLAGSQYGSLHKEFGISEVDWKLVTQEEHWTMEQMRASRAIIASVVEVALTVAGMPPVPLPAQYVAAVIAIVVAPEPHGCRNESSRHLRRFCRFWAARNYRGETSHP